MDRVGAQLQAEIIEGRLKEKIVFEVSAIEANWGIAFKTVSSGRMPWEAEYRLVPNGGSSARLVQDVRLRLGGLMVLLSPLMRGEVQKKGQQEIEKLKELLETGKIWSATAPEVPIPRGLFLPTES